MKLPWESICLFPILEASGLAFPENWRIGIVTCRVSLGRLLACGAGPAT